MIKLQENMLSQNINFHYTDIQIILNQGGRSYYLILSENYINSIFILGAY